MPLMPRMRVIQVLEPMGFLMSKLTPGVWRLAKYVLPLVGLVPVAFGISVGLDKLAPEKAQAALSKAPAVPAATQRETTSASKVALLIANAKYPDANAPLNHPVKDAQALADQLRRSGFDVDVQENLGKEEMTRALDSFKAKIKPGSVALVSFSGFGIQADRQSYLIPVNAQIWKETDVRRDGISIDAVLADMHERGASVKLAIVDASRRNPFERRFRAYSAGLAAIDSPQGTLLMSAAAPGKVAYDGPGDNSLLMGELLKEIVLPGQSAEAVFNHTRLGVSRASNGEQVPLVSSSLVSNFTFVPSNAKIANLSNAHTVIDEPGTVTEPTDAVVMPSTAPRANPVATAAVTPSNVDERPSAATTEKKQATENPPQYKLQSRPTAAEKSAAALEKPTNVQKSTTADKPARIVKAKKTPKHDDDEVVPRRRYSDPERSILRQERRPFFGMRRHPMYGGSPWSGPRFGGRLGIGF
jgi:Caspase domain